MVHSTDFQPLARKRPRIPLDPASSTLPAAEFPTGTCIGLFLLAFLLRILPAATVFWTDEVMLRDADATYHLRRVVYFLHNFPATLATDSYVQFPHGSKIIWPAFLDVCFGLVLWPVHALAEITHSDSIHAVSVASAWLPPIIGSATVALTFLLARKRFGHNQGLVAALLLSVLGGHWVYSQLGALDHHVVVSLVSLLILSSMLQLLSSAHKPLQQASLLGLWVGLGILVWPGNLLYAGLALLGLAVAALLASDKAARLHRFHGLAAASAVAICCVAPFCLGQEWPQWSSLSPVVLTYFQPWILTCALLVGLFGGMLTRHPNFAAYPFKIATALALFSGILLGASFALGDGLALGLAEAWQWLGKGEDFQSSVIESQGLFVVGGEYTTYMATLQLSPLVYAFPLIWAYGVFEAHRSQERDARVFLLCWSLILFLITILQKRFVDTFSIALALQTGIGAFDLLRRLKDNRMRAGVVAAIGITSIFTLYALIPNYRPHAENLWSMIHDEPPSLNRFQRADFIMSGISRWIREYTPRTSGWLDQSEQPEYGIMASWGHGHMLQHVARRPTITDNFGDDAGKENFDFEKQFWASSPDEADTILDRLGVRYVIVTGGNARLPGYGPNASYRSLYLYDGSRAREQEEPTDARPRMRLVRESQKLQTNLRYAFAKVFEVVPGARIHGRTVPNRTLLIRLQVRTNRGRDFFYFDETRSSSSGAFEFVVPYPNSGGPESLVVASGYQILCGRTGRVVEISEVEIQSAASIEVGDPCAPQKSAAQTSPSN